MTLPPPPDDDSRRQQASGMPGTPGGPGGASPADRSSVNHDALDVPLPAGLVVPDDLSALDEEVRAYRRERARDRRNLLLSRLFLTRRWYRYGLSGPIVVAVLLVVGFGGALLSFLAPSPGQRLRSPALPPLAASPGPVGTSGGLLPEARLSGEEGTVAARSIRPAAIVLLPPRCGCAKLVHDVAVQADAAAAGLQTAAVVAPDDPVLTELANNPGAGGGRIRPLADVDGALSRQFAPVTLPLLLAVRVDGRLAGAPLSLHPGDMIASAIAPLVTAG